MKHRFVHLLSVVCYWCGMDALFYALNRRAKRIITFHNVLLDELFRPGLANGVSNRLSEFKSIIRECRRRFPISNDLFDARTLTITFDDGYRNQYSTAFKYLREKDLPAILFVAGDLMPDRQGDGGWSSCLNIDLLLHWVAEMPLEQIPGGNRLNYWMSTVWPAFVSHSPTLPSRRDLIDIVSKLPSDYLCERLGSISAAELDEMRAAGWQIGWHTKSHVPLVSLAEDAVRGELMSPPAYRAVCLSYPFGNPEEVGPYAPEIAAKLGYPCAVSNTNMVPANVTSRYFLPRLALPADKYDLHFELSGLKFFLKNRRLLPKVLLRV